jgi:hypothetical protein
VPTTTAAAAQPSDTRKRGRQSGSNPKTELELLGSATNTPSMPRKRKSPAGFSPFGRASQDSLWTFCDDSTQKREFHVPFDLLRVGDLSNSTNTTHS